MADGDFDESDRDRLHTAREIHLDALKGLQDEINDEEMFAEFTPGDLAVRAELLRSHYKNMGSAHILYRQCALLSSNEIYVEATRNYMRTLARIENRIKQLERDDPMRSPPLANSTAAAGATDCPLRIKQETTNRKIQR